MSLEILQEYKAYIDDYLRNYYTEMKKEPQKQLFEAMEYSMLGGGKRLRPIFAMEFCRACCGDWKKAVSFAGALEMIQTYSLIHDDLPCMDNDDYRRGRLTNHKVYGEAMAVLAGDALLTDAFGLAATSDTDRIAFAIQVLSQCCGSLGMVGGQVLDMDSENRLLTEREVLDIQTRKTGALINASCVLGVIAGGGSEAQLEAASRYAAGVGLAFQIRDDMLDVIGTAGELGKSVGTDAQKNTFVRLYGLEKCDELVKKYTDMAIDALSAFDDNQVLADLAHSLTERRV